MARMFIPGALVALVAGAAIGDARAEEQSLAFRLVTHRIAVNVVEAPVSEGHTIGSGELKGVAVFEDGRIADKAFAMLIDGDQLIGYSRYSFVDGSSIALRFEAADDEAGVLDGAYTVLSGTGQYEGVTGTGWFKEVEEPWDGASLFDGGFELTLP